MKSVGAHLCFPGAKDGDEYLGKPMRYLCRAVCGALLGEVDGGVAELKLLATI